MEKKNNKILSKKNKNKYNRINFKLVKSIIQASRIKSVNFSPDGDKIVSGSFDGTIKIWSLVNMHQIKK